MLCDLQVVLHPEAPDLASYFLFYRWGAPHASDA